MGCWSAVAAAAAARWDCTEPSAELDQEAAVAGAHIFATALFGVSWKRMSAGQREMSYVPLFPGDVGF